MRKEFPDTAPSVEAEAHVTQTVDEVGQPYEAAFAAQGETAAATQDVSEEPSKSDGQAFKDALKSKWGGVPYEIARRIWDLQDRIIGMKGPDGQERNVRFKTLRRIGASAVSISGLTIASVVAARYGLAAADQLFDFDSMNQDLAHHGGSHTPKPDVVHLEQGKNVELAHATPEATPKGPELDVDRKIKLGQGPTDFFEKMGMSKEEAQDLVQGKSDAAKEARKVLFDSHNKPAGHDYPDFYKAKYEYPDGHKATVPGLNHTGELSEHSQKALLEYDKAWDASHGNSGGTDQIDGLNLSDKQESELKALLEQKQSPVKLSGDKLIATTSDGKQLNLPLPKPGQDINKYLNEQLAAHNYKLTDDGKIVPITKGQGEGSGGENGGEHDKEDGGIGKTPYIIGGTLVAATAVATGTYFGLRHSEKKAARLRKEREIRREEELKKTISQTFEYIYDRLLHPDPTAADVDKFRFIQSMDGNFKQMMKGYFIGNGASEATAENLAKKQNTTLTFYILGKDGNESEDELYAALEEFFVITNNEFNFRPDKLDAYLQKMYDYRQSLASS